MKTILITGATGFIGHHLVDLAVKMGTTIIAGVRRTSKINSLIEKDIPIEYLDLYNPNILLLEINQIISKYGNIDVVVHIAGITQSLHNNDYYKVNFDLTKNLIDTLIIAEGITPKFIFISSISALGPGDPITLQPITEDIQPHPVTHYGKSKLLAEKYISEHYDSWIILRPTVVYGEHEKNFLNIISTIKKGFELYIGSTDQLLSTIYVKDLVDFILVIANSKVSNSCINISDGEDYSITKVVSIIKSIIRKRTYKLVLPIGVVRLVAIIMEIIGRITGNAPILNRDKLNELKEVNWTCDNSRMKKILDDKPLIKLKEGLTISIDWYRNNGWI